MQIEVVAAGQPSSVLYRGTQVATTTTVGVMQVLFVGAEFAMFLGLPGMTKTRG
jgi:hypothetical protein